MYTKQSTNGFILKAFSFRGYPDEVMGGVFDVANSLFEQSEPPTSTIDVCNFSATVCSRVGIDGEPANSIYYALMYLLNAPGLFSPEEYYYTCERLFQKLPNEGAVDDGESY